MRALARAAACGTQPTDPMYDKAMPPLRATPGAQWRLTVSKDLQGGWLGVHNLDRRCVRVASHWCFRADAGKCTAEHCKFGRAVWRVCKRGVTGGVVAGVVGWWMRML
jgi:hypothetical protein